MRPGGRSSTYLLVEELGEETLGLERGNVAAVVAPDEDASLDVQQEERGHRARHGGGGDLVHARPPDLDLHPSLRLSLSAAGGGHSGGARGEGALGSRLPHRHPTCSRRCGAAVDRSRDAKIGEDGSGEGEEKGRIRMVFLRTSHWTVGPVCCPM